MPPESRGARGSTRSLKPTCPGTQWLADFLERWAIAELCASVILTPSAFAFGDLVWGGECRPPRLAMPASTGVDAGLGVLLRKEVIQPQVPLRLPCYDFIPVTTHTFGRCLLSVSSRTSGTSDSHDVTGGVYKARERIHGAVADAPLLAIPASCCRVADNNLNWARF